MTDPKDPTKLIKFPEGIKVLLMVDGKPVKNKGSKAETDADGKVVLAPNRSTILKRPNYHFRIDLDERTYFDIDNKKLVKSKSIKEFDEKNLMEIPMVIDTRDDGFHYDKAQLPLTDGMLKKYKRTKKGEGTESDPVVLEVRFYWYYLKLKYYNCIKDSLADVPRGLPIVANVDGKDYLSIYIKDPKYFGYVIDNDNKRIQHYLNLLGFEAGPVNGIIDDKTEKALKAFQKHYGLAENGNADSDTKQKLELVYCRRTIGAIINNSYAIPVWKKNSGFNLVYFETSYPKLELMTADEAAMYAFFLYTKNKDTEPKLVTRRKIEADNKDSSNKNIPWEKLDFLKARHYYDLPAKWSSRNYWTRYDKRMDQGGFFDEVMKNKVKLYPFTPDELKRSDKTKPLLFSLDDVVLIKADGSQVVKDKDASDNSINLKTDSVGKKDGSRLTIFNVKEVDKGGGKKEFDLVLHDLEDANATFFSKVVTTSANFKRNYISNVPKNARIIVFANDFYAVNNKRTAQKGEPFDPAKHVRGCRAAMFEDKDCHYHVKLKNDPNPFGHQRYYSRFAGNFELHFVYNGWPIKGPDGLILRSFLIVYWNGRFKSDAGTHKRKKPDGTFAINPATGTQFFSNTATAAQINTFRTKGMKNAKERWDSKGYTLEPTKGKCKIQIKPVFFFEGKLDGIGGGHKCMVTVSNNINTGWMAIETSEMYLDDYKDRDYLGVGEFPDVDGKRYKTLVVSHELGHAQGKLDDYAYEWGGINNFAKNTDDGDFSQYYLGMPYKFDTGSMMNDNRAPRMRYLSNFLNWLNDASKDVNALKKFLNEELFTIVHRFGTKTLKYNLPYDPPAHPDDYRDVLSAFKKKKGFPLETGKLDFALYRLGEDETAYNLLIKNMRQTFPFNGIIVVYLKLGFTFVNDKNNWTPYKKYKWMSEVRKTLTEMNNRFILTSKSKGNEFKNTFLALFPVCLERTAADAKAHYEIIVKYDESSSIHERNGRKLKLGSDVSKNWLVNYILGDDDGAFVAFFKWLFGLDKIGKSEVEITRDWLRKELNDNSIELIEK